MHRRHWSAWLVPVVLTLTAGCQQPPDTRPDGLGVQDAFAAFQKALKDRDADRIWDLLSTQSQADVERAAKKINVPAREFLKKDEFYRKPLDEVPEAKFTGVTATGDRASVSYTEADGDKLQLGFVKEGGKWKVSLPLSD